MESPYSTSKPLTLDSGQSMFRTDEHFELSVRRWQLRGEITKQLQDKVHEEQLNRTKVSYNDVMNALHDLESGRRVDPVDILPGEILTDILKRLTDQKWDEQIGKNIDVLFPLMLVSKKWRQFMISEHLLWNHVVIKDGRPVEIVKRQLELSGNTPITLWLNLPLEYWSALRPALIKHRERIEVIVFYELSDLNSPVEGVHGPLRKWLPKVLEELGRLPNLRTLRKLFRIDWEDYVHDVLRIIDLCQGLEEMVNFAFTAQALRMAKDRVNITEIITYEDVDVILPVAEGLKELREVAFMAKPFLFQLGSNPRSQELPTPGRQLNWSHLTYHLEDHSILIPLLHRLHGLTSLDINTDFITIKNLTSIIHNFAKLLSFKVFVTLHDGDIMSPPATVFANLHVAALDISICTPSYYFRPNDIYERKRLLNSAHQVPAMISNSMPNARSLRLSLIGDTGYPFFSLADHFTGDKMTLEFNITGEMHVTGMTIPSSVKELVLRCDQSLAADLFSQSVTHFEFIVDRNQLLPKSPKKEINLDNWPALETITLFRNSVHWKGHTHSSLRRILMPEMTIGTLFYDVTPFIRDLALSPESYPCLEEIQLGAAPEWDILVIMLERRNLLADRGIKPITKLRLRHPIPPFIYRILAELMRCKWPARPSNKELSLAGNVNSILCRNIPGCYACHRMLLSCKEPIGEDWKAEEDWTAKGDYNEKAFLEKSSDYPDDDIHVLETWDARAKLWKSWEDGGRWREECCSIHYGTLELLIDANSYI